MEFNEYWLYVAIIFGSDNKTFSFVCNHPSLVSCEGFLQIIQARLNTACAVECRIDMILHSKTVRYFDRGRASLRE